MFDYAIDSYGSANRAVKEIKEMQNAIKNQTIDDTKYQSAKEMIAYYEKEIAHYQEIMQKKVNEIQEKIDSAMAQLEEFHKNAEGKKDSKAEINLKLADGTLSYKKEYRDVQKIDDKALLKYLQDNHPAYVKTEYKPVYDKFKGTCKAVGDVVIDGNGEIVEGLGVKVTPAEFRIK